MYYIGNLKVHFPISDEPVENRHTQTSMYTYLPDPLKTI